MTDRSDKPHRFSGDSTDSFTGGMDNTEGWTVMTNANDHATDDATESVAHDTATESVADDATCPTCGRHPYRPYTDLHNDHACVDACHYVACVWPSSYASRFARFHGRHGTRLASYVAKQLAVRDRARAQLARY